MRLASRRLPGTTTFDPIERVAADLRRFAVIVADSSRHDLVRLCARLAYLDRLRAACLQLGIEHRLDELHGLARHFEVVRCERALGRLGVLSP